MVPGCCVPMWRRVSHPGPSPHGSLEPPPPHTHTYDPVTPVCVTKVKRSTLTHARLWWPVTRRDRWWLPPRVRTATGLVCRDSSTKVSTPFVCGYFLTRKFWRVFVRTCDGVSCWWGNIPQNQLVPFIWIGWFTSHQTGLLWFQIQLYKLKVCLCCSHNPPSAKNILNTSFLENVFPCYKSKICQWS